MRGCKQDDSSRHHSSTHLRHDDVRLYAAVEHNRAESTSCSKTKKGTKGGTEGEGTKKYMVRMDTTDQEAGWISHTWGALNAVAPIAKGHVLSENGDVQVQQVIAEETFRRLGVVVSPASRLSALK
ncbi:hypothetical protein J3458_002834 [Metarhizium acridum]|uniref:uncharacterized protein n=1 Tax=Metarhizium acridum TaxID=92637 RepID=UPI001C6AE57C|nr:hypothetical protein J3458_002834 [Metarhizium acridum]